MPFPPLGNIVEPAIIVNSCKYSIHMGGWQKTSWSLHCLSDQTRVHLETTLRNRVPVSGHKYSCTWRFVMTIQQKAWAQSLYVCIKWFLLQVFVNICKSYIQPKTLIFYKVEACICSMALLTTVFGPHSFSLSMPTVLYSLFSHQVNVSEMWCLHAWWRCQTQVTYIYKGIVKN